MAPKPFLLQALKLMRWGYVMYTVCAMYVCSTLFWCTDKNWSPLCNPHKDVIQSPCFESKTILIRGNITRWEWIHKIKLLPGRESNNCRTTSERAAKVSHSHVNVSLHPSSCTTTSRQHEKTSDEVDNKCAWMEVVPCAFLWPKFLNKLN